MNVWKPTAVVAVLGLALSLGVQVASAEPIHPPTAGACHGQPNMQAALDRLKQGRALLESAEHNKGGWRDRAIVAADSAIRDTTAGCDYADAH